MSIKLLSIVPKNLNNLKVTLSLDGTEQEYDIEVLDDEDILGFHLGPELIAFLRPHFSSRRALLELLTDYCEGMNVELPSELPKDGA